MVILINGWKNKNWGSIKGLIFSLLGCTVASETNGKTRVHHFFVTYIINSIKGWQFSSLCYYNGTHFIP